MVCVLPCIFLIQAVCSFQIFVNDEILGWMPLKPRANAQPCLLRTLIQFPQSRLQELLVPLYRECDPVNHNIGTRFDDFGTVETYFPAPFGRVGLVREPVAVHRSLFDFHRPQSAIRPRS